MAENVKSVAVVIVNYRTADLAIACVDALAGARVAIPGLKVVVVDGGSGDGSAEQIAKAIASKGQTDWVTALPLDTNGGFAFANNRAVLHLAAKGETPETIALINPDARVRPGALEAMVALLDREGAAGAVGAQLVHEDGRRQASAFHFPSLRGEFCRGLGISLVDRLLGHPPSRIDVSVASRVPWVTGAAVVFRTSALQAAGLFDEGFFLYFEETDLMRRLNAAAWDIWHEPAARVVHDGGAATQIRDPETGLPKKQRLPRYWYASRRRYFALAGGATYAFACGLAWLGGYTAGSMVRFILRKKGTGPLRPIRDFVQFGLWPKSTDVEYAFLKFGMQGPSTPAWMST